MKSIFKIFLVVFVPFVSHAQLDTAIFKNGMWNLPIMYSFADTSFKQSVNKYRPEFIVLIADSSRAVVAMDTGVVTSVILLHDIYGYEVSFGEYTILYFGLDHSFIKGEKSILKKGDKIEKGQFLGKVGRDYDHHQYKLDIILYNRFRGAMPITHLLNWSVSHNNALDESAKTVN